MGSEDKITLEAELKDAGFRAQAAATSKTIGLWRKELDAAAKAGRAAKIPISELKRVTGLLGKELTTSLNPALNLTERELYEVERAANAAGRGVRSATTVMGASTAQANAFTRATTRGVAALGFISPTAATATQQILGLSNVSAGATIALAAGAVGAIALAGGIIKSTKASIAFESSFRGIRKTVNGTEKEFAQLARTNRDLAITLGQNVNTINEIGQAAGQLGIAVKDLAQFEQIVIELASASDISAKAAAFSFGGLIKVLSLTIQDLDSLTDQIVALGNAFPATESEIVGFLNRIAGAGAVLGLTEVQLANIAASFASLRIPAEAGGTAVQKVFLAMQKAAVVGGAELEEFAEAVNLTGEEFRKLVQADPAGAFEKFVTSLGKQGAQALITLEKLGLQNERTRRTFLTAASAGGHLSEVIRLGTAANAESIARSEEFNKELDTTAGQLRVAGSALNEVAISLGDNFLPAVSAAAAGVVILAEGLGKVGNVAGFILDIGLPAQEQALKEFEDGLGDLGDGNQGKNWAQVWTENVEQGLIDGIKEAGIGIEKSLSLFGRLIEGQNIRTATSDISKGIDTRDAVQEIDALTSAFGSAQEFAGLMGGAIAEIDLDQLEQDALAAEKALTSLFRDPTKEEVQANLQGLRIKREIFALERRSSPLTAEDKKRLAILKAQLATSNRIASAEVNRRKILQLENTLLQEQLTTTNDLALAVANARADADKAAGRGVIVKQEDIEIDIDIDHALNALRFLSGEINGVIGVEREIAMAIKGEDEILSALGRILENAELVEGEYIITVATSGADAVLRDIERVILAIANFDAVVAQSLFFKLGVTKEKQGLVSMGLTPDQIVARARLNELVAIATDDPSLDAASLDKLAGSATKAAKVIDPLKDGIITLAEALEFGFTAATAASAELDFALGKLKDRTFRTSVELIKLDSAEAQRLKTMGIEITLLERDIERRKEINALFIEEAVTMTELNNALGGTGLQNAADTFRFAIQGLGEEFQQAEESVLQFLHRLTAAALEAVQTNFDALFARPSREQAQADLELARLRARRARLLFGGRSEDELQDLLKPLDREIEAIEKVTTLRAAEFGVLQAQGIVADQTLKTDQQILSEARALIPTIAAQSALTANLNDSLILENIWRGRAIESLISFTSALGGAAAALPGGRGGSVQVNVELSLDNILARVREETEEALRDAGFGGSIGSGGGTFSA